MYPIFVEASGNITEAALSPTGKEQVTMKRIRKKFRDMKYRHKLTILLVTSSLVPMTMLALYSHNSMSRLVRHNEVEDTSSILEQTRESIDSQIEVYTGLINYLTYSPDIEEVINEKNMDNYVAYAKYTQIVDPLLTVPKSYHDAINQIQIFADSIKVRHEYTLVPMDEIGQEWWSSQLNDEVQVQWLVNTEKPEIAAVRNIYDGRNRTAVLCITLDYNKIFKPLKNIISDESGTMVLDQSQNIVYRDENIQDNDLADLRESDKILEQISKEYENDVKGTLQKLADSVGDTSADLTGLTKQINASAKGVYTLTDTAGSDLSEIQTCLDDSGKLLRKSANKIKKITDKLTKAKDNGDYADLEHMIYDNKSGVSAFLSAPVELNTKKIYPIDNYGSSMAPFYSTLSIWIGGIVLVAMLKVTVSEESIKKMGLKNVKIHEIYLGRWIIFLILGLLQSTLIALGDLYYLGIQCAHTFLFLFGCWFSSIVYVTISYTLTVSFGDIGKAGSVVLLVMQVAGTGGTFPIECAPKFFRAVYPLLPFTHSMAALRESVGGCYGNDYWMDLAKLGIFLVIALFMGLVLRKPIIRMNEAFTEQLEETKII